MNEDFKFYFSLFFVGFIAAFPVFMFFIELPSEQKSKCELKITREQNCVSVYVPENLVNDVNQLIMGNTK